MERANATGRWSFNCQRIHRRSSGLHAFVRILLPLDVDSGLLRDAAREIADNVAFSSGHGGLTFTYDPWFMGSAFDGIYALARRHWCIDVEHLNTTLPLMREGISTAPTTPLRPTWRSPRRWRRCSSRSTPSSPASGSPPTGDAVGWMRFPD